MLASPSLVPAECPRSDRIASERERHVVHLGEAIAELAARVHAATYELLVLLREFDACAGWNNGCLSCAHWLHWRTGIDLGAAREKVRVARALAALPRISAAMQRGALSYAKVRALTRIATPENERRLVDLALAGTAAHVERLVRAWRRVDDEGMVVLRGRLTPEIGAVVQRAIEAAADRLFQESTHALAGNRIVDEDDPAQRRADALGRLAECALAGGLDRGTAGDRYQVVLHVDAAGLQPVGEAASHASDDGRAVVELDDGATNVPRKRPCAWPATARWWSCSMPPTARCSTWGARRGRSQRPFDARSSPATGAASFPAAPRGAATATTFDIGPTEVRPAWTTSRCCAGAIIAPYMRKALRSCEPTMASSCSIGRMARVWRRRPQCLDGRRATTARSGRHRHVSRWPVSWLGHPRRHLARKTDPSTSVGRSTSCVPARATYSSTFV